MTAQIDEACVEGLTAKLRGLDLSEAEGVLLDQIVYRAMIAEPEVEVEGFTQRTTGALSIPATAIAAAAGMLGPSGPRGNPKPTGSAFICGTDDPWVR